MNTNSHNRLVAGSKPAEPTSGANPHEKPRFAPEYCKLRGYCIYWVIRDGVTWFITGGKW